MTEKENKDKCGKCNCDPCECEPKCNCCRR